MLPRRRRVDEAIHFNGGLQRVLLVGQDDRAVREGDLGREGDAGALKEGKELEEEFVLFFSFFFFTSHFAEFLRFDQQQQQQPKINVFFLLSFVFRLDLERERNRGVI